MVALAADQVSKELLSFKNMDKVGIEEEQESAKFLLKFALEIYDTSMEIRLKFPFLCTFSSLFL